MTDGERIPSGTLIDGRYEIRGHLGEGGMGTVYRAVDMKMGQPVAIKMLLQGGANPRSREERRRRFMNEIYAINEVAHRNVVQVLEFGFHKDTPFMVMELLKGRDLGRVIHESADLLPIDYCVDMMLIVCAAIRACHQKGIVHRDLKPSNVMVIDSDSGPGWDVKVLDFSISSVSRVAADLTREGQILGTPRFLSPEQVSGKALPASDQYAIGLLLYLCLTKTHPFAELDGLPLIRAIERGEIPRPTSLRPDIPEGLERVILRAIHVDPAERFGSVHDLGRELWPFASQLGQGLWKKYYFETPPAPHSRLVDSKPSVGSIPVLLKMVQGQVPLDYPATASAHYQSTTAVREMDTAADHEAQAAAAGSPRTLADPQQGPNASGRQVSPSAPSGWQWQSSTDGAVSASLGMADPPGKSRWLTVGAALLLGVGLLAAGALGMKSMMRKSPPPAPAVASEPTKMNAAAPPAPGVVAPPPPASAAAPPTLPGPSPGSQTANAAGPTVGPKRSSKTPKRRDHSRAERRKPAEATWETDANGVPIPPF